MKPSLRKKIYAAVLAVAMSLTGMFTGLRWLTLAALVLWVGAMIVFGRGERYVTSGDESSS